MLLRREAHYTADNEVFWCKAESGANIVAMIGASQVSCIDTVVDDRARKTLTDLALSSAAHRHNVIDNRRAFVEDPPRENPVTVRDENAERRPDTA